MRFGLVFGMMALLSSLLVCAGCGQDKNDSAPTVDAPQAPPIPEGESAQAGIPAPTQSSTLLFGSIAGRVMSQHGKPMVNLRLGYRSGDSSVSYSRTGDDGQFRLTALSPGTYRFSLYKHDSGPEEHTLANPELKLEPGQNLDSVTLNAQVLEAGSVRGRVLDLEEKPIVGAKLVCAEAIEPTATTNERGEFSFSFRAPEGAVTIMTDRGNYGERAVEDIAIGTDNLDVVLERGGTLTGIVRDKKTKSVVTRFRVRVKPEQVSTEEYCLPQYETEIQAEDGRFHLDAIAPGRMRVTVLSADFAPVEHPAEVSDGKTAEPLEFLMGSAEQAVRGRVVDALTGRGVPQARIYTRPNELEYGEGYLAETDQSGAFTLEELSGPKTVWIETKSNYPQQSVNLDPKVKPLVLQLNPGTKLSGFVRSNRRPVDGAPVTALLQGGNADSPVRFQRTDRRGYYEFTTLPDGRYRIEAVNILDPKGAGQDYKVRLRGGESVQQDFDF